VTKTWRETGLKNKEIGQKKTVERDRPFGDRTGPHKTDPQGGGTEKRVSKKE